MVNSPSGVVSKASPKDNLTVGESDSNERKLSSEETLSSVYLPNVICSTLAFQIVPWAPLIWMFFGIETLFKIKATGIVAIKNAM